MSISLSVSLSLSSLAHPSFSLGSLCQPGQPSPAHEHDTRPLVGMLRLSPSGLTRSQCGRHSHNCCKFVCSFGIALRVAIVSWACRFISLSLPAHRDCLAVKSTCGRRIRRRIGRSPGSTRADLRLPGMKSPRFRTEGAPPPRSLDPRVSVARILAAWAAQARLSPAGSARPAGPSAAPGRRSASRTGRRKRGGNGERETLSSQR